MVAAFAGDSTITSFVADIAGPFRRFPSICSTLMPRAPGEASGMDLTASHPHLGTGAASARLTPGGFDIDEVVADSRARARPGGAAVGARCDTYT